MVVCSQREVETRVGILRQFAAGFTDYRNTDLIEHRVEELVAQRVHGRALGYEDLNDYGELRNESSVGGVGREREDRDCEGDVRGTSPVPRDGTRRPVVQRVRLPDAGELESCAVGGGQGRASEK